MAEIHATRALALVGVPFRPQGRSAADGLDCAGLALAAFELPADLVRNDYRLRGRHRARLGCVEGDVLEGILPAGSGVGLVRECVPVQQVVDELLVGLFQGLEALERLVAAGSRDRAPAPTP